MGEYVVCSKTNGVVNIGSKPVSKEIAIAQAIAMNRKYGKNTHWIEAVQCPKLDKK